MLEIELFQTASADFTQNIDLDNVNVTIRLTYNVRNGSFRMNVNTENYSLQGLKVVIEWPLMDAHKASIDIPGDFLLRKDTNITQEVELTYDNMGTTYRLYYLTADEVELWERDNGFQT